MSKPERRIKRVKAGWSDVVLVCRKCSKKLDGGFGPDGDQRFAKALRKTLARSPAGSSVAKAKRLGERIGIIEVGCLDLCPKGAVVTMRGGTPDAWLVVPAGTSMEAVTRDLGLSEAPSPGLVVRTGLV